MAEAVRLVAAREHTLSRRPVSAHVIITHDLNPRVHQLMGMWSMASHCDRVLLEEISRALLQDILRDCKTLQDELRSIERWARGQIDKLPTQLRRGDSRDG